jgi:hypothetical protein
MQVLGFKELQSSFSSTFAVEAASIKAGGQEMVLLLTDALRTLNLGRASVAWTAFVAHISSIIVEGLKNAALVSLKHLHNLVLHLLTTSSSSEALNLT